MNQNDHLVIGQSHRAPFKIMPVQSLNNDIRDEARWISTFHYNIHQNDFELYLLDAGVT
jgi:hypothetical protein